MAFRSGWPCYQWFLERVFEMLIYILPILDIITAVVLFLHARFGLFPISSLLILGVYLSLKGVVFSVSDFASRIDVVCGAYIILVGLGVFSNIVISLIVFFWLMQKGVFALIPMR
jgi:hypothetical protein